MIKIYECLQIEQIEKIRKKAIGEQLDEKDNFCYHMVLDVDDIKCGAVRFSRQASVVCGEELLENCIVIDKIAVDKELPLAFKEMLVRSIVARAIDLRNCDNIVVKDCVEKSQDIYSQMNFNNVELCMFFAKPQDIVFNCKCKK